MSKRPLPSRNYIAGHWVTYGNLPAEKEFLDYLNSQHLKPGRYRTIKNQTGDHLGLPRAENQTKAYGLTPDPTKKEKKRMWPQNKEKLKKKIEELKEEKERLQDEKDALEREKKNMQFELEEKRKRAELELELERARFEAEKTKWKDELETKLAKEKQMAEIKVQETMSLSKIEAKSDIEKLKTKHAEDLSKIRQEEAEKFYNKMSESLQKMSIEGDKNTKFVHDLALQVFKAAQPNTSEHTFRELKGKALDTAETVDAE